MRSPVLALLTSYPIAQPRSGGQLRASALAEHYEQGGFEVVRQLKGGNLPLIVIVTAYDKYAIEAFEAGALDYLLKPVSQAQIGRASCRERV